MLKLLNDKCIVSKLLAYTMLVYTFSSIYYLIVTRSIGTPFNDTLTKKQLEIKKKSGEVRKQVFYKGIIYGIALIYLIQPFSDCV